MSDNHEKPDISDYLDETTEEEAENLRSYVSDDVCWRMAVLDNLRGINRRLGDLAYSGRGTPDISDYLLPEDLGPDHRPPSRWRRMVERVKTRIIEWWRPSVAFGPAGSRLRPVEEDVGASRRFFGAGGRGDGIIHPEAEE